MRRGNRAARIRWSANAVRARVNVRLARAAEMAAPPRRDVWAGFICIGGRIAREKWIGVNLYCVPGRARFRAVWSDGSAAAVSPAQILRRLKAALVRLRLPVDP